MGSELIKNTINSNNNKNIFNELEEIDQPEKISINKINNLTEKSNSEYFANKKFNFNVLLNDNKTSEDFKIANNFNERSMENIKDIKTNISEEVFSAHSIFKDINYTKSTSEQFDLIEEDINDIEHDKILKNLEQKNLLKNNDKISKKISKKSPKSIIINEIKKSDNKKIINENIESNLENDVKSIKKQTDYEEKNSKKKKTEKIEEEPEELETLDEADEDKGIEELSESDGVEELESLEDDLDILIDNIDTVNNSIKYPGKIDILKIDENLTDKKIEAGDEKNKFEDVYGVNRVQVFYNIDKQLYKSRSITKYSPEKLSRTKKGLLLPISVVIASIFVFILGYSAINIYLKATEKVDLADNIFKDDSIMTQLAQQLNEEKRVAAQKLEEEMKKLEEERKNRQSIIEEELLKKETEIENKFNKRIEEIRLQKGITEQEIIRLTKEYEEAKLRELEAAKLFSQTEQEKLNDVLKQKELEIEDTKIKLAQERENIQLEIERLRRENELRRLEEEKFIKLANLKQEEIKTFNSTVYQLMKAGMDDLKNYRYDESIKKFDSVIDFYNSRIDFINKNEDLVKKMETDLIFVKTLKNLIDSTRYSKTREYEKIVKKFENINNLYQRAENFNNEKNYARSGKEYQRVLEEIEQINESYKKLKDIEKNSQNSKAYELYNSGLLNLKNNNQEKAIENFTQIIKNTPLSDYTDDAVNEIVKISRSASFTIKTQEQNDKAKTIFAQAQNLAANKNYDEALKLYNQIITDYPYSTYTKNAFEENQKINEMKNKETGNKSNEELLRKNEEDLKNKFEMYFEKYKEAYKNGDVESARKYYFEALNNAFSIYTNNSLNEFITVENNYISELIKKSGETSSLSNKEKNEIITKFENQIKERDILIENYKIKIDEISKNQNTALNAKEKQELIANYEKQIKEKENIIDSYKRNIDELSKNREFNLTEKEKNELIDKYESQIKDREQTIEKLKFFIRENEKSLTQEQKDELIKEYQNRIKLEKDKSDTLKKQLYDYYKKNSELESKIEQSNTIKSDYNDLVNKYKELLQKYDAKTISKEEKERIEKELLAKLEKELKEKYNKEKIAEIEKEKNKIKKDFEEELKNMKDYINTLKFSNLADSTKLELKNQLFARITAVTLNSIDFQFLTLNNDNFVDVKNGDTVQVIRLVIIEGKKMEISTGFVKITSVKDNSIYGRGQIISSGRGYSVQIGDLLKY
ncbi:MAG: hypothetical protein JXB50_10035 [Spirochaetes bacterium]|nr:hypothetical protein [Spirochaetota bacterium]